MHVAAVRAIQRRLKELGHYVGRVDGDRGPQTDRAVELALAERSRDLPDAWPGWSGQRRAVAFLQLMCIDAGFDAGEIDGLWGPQTEFAFESFEVLRETGEPPVPWRDDEPLDVNPNNWRRRIRGRSRLFTDPMERPDASRRHPHASGRVPLDITPRLGHQPNREVDQYPRESGEEPRADPRTYPRALRRGSPPGSAARSVRRQLRPAAKAAWNKLVDACLGDRHRLGPEQQQARMGAGSRFAGRPDYADWWHFWEEEGWVSLGRARNFDWMHVQGARL